MARVNKKDPGVEASVLERLTYACKQLGIEVEDVGIEEGSELSSEELSRIFKQVRAINPDYILSGSGSPIKTNVKSTRIKDYSGINQRFRKLRLKSELTQKEIGEILGLKRSSIAAIEQNNQTISFAVLRILKQKFNVSYEYMLDGEAAPISNPVELQRELEECRADKKALRDALNRYQRD